MDRLVLQSKIKKLRREGGRGGRGQFGGKAREDSTVDP